VSLEVARAAAASSGDGVTGFDLAGLEATAPSLEPHVAAFELARDAGLGISVHAGEWGGATQVRAALRVEPNRIAHGGPAADDDDLMAELKRRGVTLDLCPTSNVQAGLVASMSDHPLKRLVGAGVPVTVSTDDRTVSATNLSRELALTMDPLGLARGDVVRLTRLALEAAFLQDDEMLRSRLLEALKEDTMDTRADAA
jgi:adenosine deaminase